MARKLGILWLVWIALGIALLGSSPARAVAKAKPVTTPTRRLFSAPYPFGVVGLSGNLALIGTRGAAWNDPDGPFELSTLDLTTLQRTVVCTSTVTKGGSAGGADLSGQTAVWADDRDTTSAPYRWWSAPYGNTNIYARDLSTGREYVVCSDPGDQIRPVIDGDYVVWEDWSGVEWGQHNSARGPMGIRLRGVNLRTGERFTVAGPAADFMQADISNGWVVFTAYAARETGAIYAYEIATGRVLLLSNGQGMPSIPKIGPNGFVAWNVQQGMSSNVMASNVYAPRPVWLTSGKADHSGPVVGGKMVVHLNQPGSSYYRISGIDLLAGTEFGISPAAEDINAYFPLDDGRVGWIEDNFHTLKGATWWPNGATFTLCIAQPTVFDVFSVTDPYLTTAEQSARAFPEGSDTVVLSSAQWQDTASASGMAGPDSSLLLTGRDGIPPSTANEIRRLHPGRVVVVGGTGAVSPAVESAVQSLVESGTVVERIGGQNGPDTSLLVASRVAAESPRDGTIIVAPLRGFASGATAAAVVSARRVPIVYLGAKRFSKGDLSRMRAAGVRRVVVVGENKLISDAAVKQLKKAFGAKKVTRIAGKNAVETSARFDEYAIRRFGMGMNGLSIATPSGGMDSLLASVGGRKSGSLLLLTDRKKLSASAAKTIKKRRVAVRRAQYVGSGRRGVSTRVRREVRQIVR